MVYVITEGQYRDYHIERIYDDYGAAWRYYNSLKEQRGFYPIFESYFPGDGITPGDGYKRYHVVCCMGKWKLCDTDDMVTNEIHDYLGDNDDYFVVAKDEAEARRIAKGRHNIWKKDLQTYGL